jgi:inner membrane transporter RhtA
MPRPSEPRARGPLSAALPFLAALAAMACFQVGAAVAKSLFPVVGPEGTASLRLALAAPMLVALTRPWRAWPGKRAIPVLLAFGLAIGATMLCFYLALERVPLGVAISLQFLGPLAVAIGSSRKLADLVWAALAAAGVWCLVGVGALGGKIDPLGVLFALGAAAGWGVYIVVGRMATDALGGATAALSVSVAAIVVAPIGLWRAGWALFSPQILPLALLVAFLSAAAPFSLELYALARLPRRTFATFTSLEPSFGVLAGLMLLHQQLTVVQTAGVAMVIAAATGAAWSSADRRPAPAALD